MGLLARLRRVFRKGDADADMPYSIVMLLRCPYRMTQGVLEAAASRAYGVPYDGSDEMHFVVAKARTMVRAGKFVISVLEASEPYLGDPVEVAKGFGRYKELEAAWSEHRIWAAFDLWNDDVPKKQAYSVLAKLVAELMDARCAGIYLPKENEFTIAADGATFDRLRRLKRS
jgi:hypothetical protein